MKEPKICKICKKSFIPNKYHPYQEVCFSLKCQHKRQIQNQKSWRTENPDYFKYKERLTFWQKARACYLETWRQNHKDYFSLKDAIGNEN